MHVPLMQFMFADSVTGILVLSFVRHAVSETTSLIAGLVSALLTLVWVAEHLLMKTTPCVLNAAKFTSF